MGALFGRQEIRGEAQGAFVTMDPEPILTAAQRLGAQQAEVFAVETEETPVRCEANRLSGMPIQWREIIAVQWRKRSLGRNG